MSSSGGEGERQSVTGGKHLDGVLAAVVSLLTNHGVQEGEIFTQCSILQTGKMELPGYFRSTKEWDLLVIRDRKLLGAMELKAQAAPSFGNNVNNRTEEALGSAEDVWTAYREGAFVDSPQPWLGYFFLLEDHPSSTKPVRNKEPHFKVFEEYNGASYAKRYELLCRKLVLERKYTSSCLLMSKRPQSRQESASTDQDKQTPQKPLLPTDEEVESCQIYSEPSPDLGARQFLSSLLRAVTPE